MIPDHHCDVKQNQGVREKTQFTSIHLNYILLFVFSGRQGYICGYILGDPCDLNALRFTYLIRFNVYIFGLLC